MRSERLEDVAVVAIGRNEGARLRACLRSVVERVAAVVYVDSGSTDDSVAFARELGCTVVALNLDIPFTAARARNAGWRAARELSDAIRFIQFVDGDCEVVAGWLDAARAEFDGRPRLGVVCGRRRERDLEASVFNRLCDIEWDTPTGETKACGGDAMMRLSALEEVNGFDPTIIAGEEPELCVRIRAAGHRIVRIDREMTLHDAAITRLDQWYQRARRSGHAYAEGAALHGRPPERHWVREHRRIWFWGAALPAAAVLGAPVTLGASLGLFCGYPLSAARIYRATRRRGRDRRDAAAYAAFTILGRVPELHGAAEYHLNRLRDTRRDLIEYK